MKFGFVLFGVACICGLAVSAPTVWVLNTNTTIDVVNAATNADLPYGTAPFQSDSLARSASGLLYTADAAGNLWDVTGAPIPVGPTGRTLIGDLDWSAPGGLWGFSNATSELFFFDLGSSNVTSASAISGLGASTVTGVAHQASTGDIFLSANTGLNTDQLFRVPFSSSSALLVGSMPIADGFSFISDIDFDASGTLYAMTWFHRHFYTVSTTTAATTFVSAGPHKDTTGMALNPVPEPGSVFVLAMGGAALLRRKSMLRK